MPASSSSPAPAFPANTLALSPRGQLLLTAAPDASALDAALLERLSTTVARGPAHLLLHLGASEIGTALPPAFSYFREFASRYVTAVCALPDADALTSRSALPAPPADELEALALAVPPMRGAEYLRPVVLESLWAELDVAFRAELAESKLPLQEFLKARNPAWNLVGRVHFNLAENRRDPDAPFAFLATYTARLSNAAKPQHIPLGQALKQYAGEANRDRLLSLLLPMQRAAEKCGWLKALVDGGQVFHPLRWSPADAFRLLQDVPTLEAAGVVVRVPPAWRAGRPPRPRVRATIGSRELTGLGTDALLDFKLDVSLEGETLTKDELKALLAGTDGLALVRGKWVQVDRDKLGAILERYRAIERLASRDGLSFAEAARLLAGAELGNDGEIDPETREWAQVTAGPWLAETLRALRQPDRLEALDPGRDLNATLRPYQQHGVQWMHLLASLGLGACLADDMGLGKTIQVLALLTVLKRENPKRGPTLLVAPASLLGNWMAEQQRFAPGLRTLLVHPSALSADELKGLDEGRLADLDLVITSYGTLQRSPLAKQRWSLVVLDEAQAIKNAGTKQAKAVKALDAKARIALTGTPIENRLGDLWSLFDFLNPGLLGSAKEFTRFTRELAEEPSRGYAPLRELVRPYVLRRLKTDRSVIADLPDKTELNAFCHLTPKQAALYAQAVKELKKSLEESDGMKRRGQVLTSLMRLRQICNHPSQWLGDGGWAEAESGKFARLRELCETIAARQEKVLVFTQFRETTAPLAAFLGGIFGRPGLVLHGETAVKKRQELVKQFQADDSVPFFVLSMKAGGTGLNLTAASHVIHFDRWWNPAVENQATDRAFRIGQKRNVLVHKFVCRGTVEERIDALIESRRKLSKDVLEGGAELPLTELSDDALLKLVSLDLNAASREA